MLADLASDDGGVAAKSSASLLADLMEQENAWLRVIFAFDGETPVGIATYNPDFSSYRGCVGAFVGDLYVLPQARGNGIGRGLLRAVAADSRDWNTQYVSLMVHRTNSAANEFYSRTGFKTREESDYLILEGDRLQSLCKPTSSRQQVT